MAAPQLSKDLRQNSQPCPESQGRGHHAQTKKHLSCRSCCNRRSQSSESLRVDRHAHSIRVPDRTYTPQTHETVHVFSESCDEWVDAHVVRILDGDRIRVEYGFGEQILGKTMHLNSENLRIPFPTAQPSPYELNLHVQDLPDATRGWSSSFESDPAMVFAISDHFQGEAHPAVCGGKKNKKKIKRRDAISSPSLLEANRQLPRDHDKDQKVTALTTEAVDKVVHKETQTAEYFGQEKETQTDLMPTQFVGVLTECKRRCCDQIVRVSSECKRRSSSCPRPTKKKIVWLKVAMWFVCAAGIIVSGIMEALLLSKRTKAWYRANHDSFCNVFLYPYNDEDMELRLQFSNKNTSSANTVRPGQVLLAGVDTKRDVKLGMQSLQSQECGLLIKPVHGANDSLQFDLLQLIKRSPGLSPAKQEGLFELHQNVTPKELQFETCRKSRAFHFEKLSFDEGHAVGAAVAALGVWVVVRLLQIARERNCLNYDARYPPTTIVETEGCWVPPPFACLLRWGTGGSRLLIQNIFRTALRPYLLYGVTSAFILKPFTSISLHEKCPQLITQTGEPYMILVAIGMGGLVSIVGVVNWIVDLKRNRHDWSGRFQCDTGCDHAYRRQGHVENLLCVITIVISFVKFLLRVPLEILVVVELRLLFRITWPRYALSRCAHVLRGFAFALWLFDTLCFVLKIVARKSALEDFVQRITQGATSKDFEGVPILVECGINKSAIQNKGLKASDLKVAGFTASDLRQFGFTASDLTDAGFTIDELQAAGFTASEVKEAGFSAAEMKNTGFRACDLFGANFTASDLQVAGFAAPLVRACGVGDSEMIAAGFQIGSVQAFGRNDDGQTNLPDLCDKKVLQVAAGLGHNLLLLEDGSVQAFGRNGNGQTNVPDLCGKKVSRVAAGGDFSLLLLEDGSVQAFGSNYACQTNVPDLCGKKVSQVAAGVCHSLLLFEDGSVQAFGSNFARQTDVPNLRGKKVSQVAAGGEHSLVLFEDGSVQAFGRNVNGQTKVPDLCGKKVLQIAAGMGHSLLLLEDGSAHAFGLNSNGQTNVPDLCGKKVSQVAAGGNQSFLLLEDGSVQAFGSNFAGQTNVPDLCGKKVSQVAAGREHSLILLEDGSVQAFGSNNGGQTNVPDLCGKQKKAFQVAAGWYHSLLLLADGSVQAFGRNDHGQTNVPDLCDKKVLQVAAGGGHSLLLFEDGSVQAFGHNFCGQANVPDLCGKKVSQVAAGERHSLQLLEDGSVQAFGSNFAGQTNVPDLCGKKVLQVAAGGEHSLVLLEDGSVQAFGLNINGQTNVPDLCGKKVLQVAAGVGHNLLLLEDGSVQAFGREMNGQASVPDLCGKKVLQVAAGGNHSLLLLEDGSAQAFGLNSYGQTNVPDLCGKNVLQVAAGYSHSVVLQADISKEALAPHGTT